MTVQQSPGQSKLTLEQLEAFLGDAPAKSGVPQDYVQAAAVLAVFDPLTLGRGRREVGGDNEQALDTLLPNCEPAGGTPKSGLWTLSIAERHRALRQLGSRAEIRKVLDANPDRVQTPLQIAFERVIDQQPIVLEEASRDDLVALLTVCEWLDGIVPDLPDRAALRRTLARFDLFAPMRRLAGTGFVGRDVELAQMSEYAYNDDSRIPLFVYGTGGVGKSTLLAKFILSSVAPRQHPVVYLDIDRATIRPEQPVTLLLDAVAQLRQQVDWPAPSADMVTKEIIFALGRQEGGRQLESASPVEPGLVTTFVQNFLPVLGKRYVFFIVDTMEEAQFLGPDVVWSLVEFLFRLHEVMPTLRVVLSGRTLPEEYASKAFPTWTPDARVPFGDAWINQLPLPTRPINLGVLEEDVAKELLAQALEGASVAPLDDRDLSDILQIVSRNPMCLKLAARLLRDEGIDKLKADRTEFLAKLKAEKVQALLYGRILRHVHGDAVSKVAYPGLVVRRIAPPVIKEVLAGPCELTLTLERDERYIFDEIRKEVALVETDPEDGSVRHRTDVRRVMLQDLTDHIDERVVKAIHDNAIDYYKGLPGPIARAEEIYHRLRRGDELNVVEGRWLAEAGPRLKSAIEELTSKQQLWLASRLGVTLAASVRATADQDAWEGQVARTADRYLQHRVLDKALAAVQERAARSPRSPIFSLESETYWLMGQHDQAIAVARRGVESASAAGAIDMALELLLKMCKIEESRGRLAEAEALAKEAAAVATHTPNRLLQLRSDTTTLRLQRQLRPTEVDERSALREKANSLVDDATQAALRVHPVTLREVAAELGKQNAKIAAMAIETLGVEVGTDEQAVAFGRAISNLKKSGGDDEPFSFIRTEMFEKGEVAPEDVREWANKTFKTSDARRLGNALGKAEGDVLDGFREYFRSGVASTMRGGSGER